MSVFVLVLILWHCVEFPPVPKMLESRSEGSMRAPAWVLHSQWVVCVLSSTTQLCCWLWKITYNLTNRLFEGSYGTPMANKWMKCKPIPVLKALVGDKQRTWWTLSPPLFPISFRFFPCTYISIFRKLLILLGFQCYRLKCPLILPDLINY